MRSIFPLFTLSLLLISCASHFNQYVNTGKNTKVRNGIWIERDTDQHGEYVSKGRYKMGERIGKWKTTYQGKKYHTEKIRNGFAKVKFYYPNGNIMEKGLTQTVVRQNERIWQYIGDWKYYDETGKLKYIKKFWEGGKADSISYLKN